MFRKPFIIESEGYSQNKFFLVLRRSDENLSQMPTYSIIKPTAKKEKSLHEFEGSRINMSLRSVSHQNWSSPLFSTPFHTCWFANLCDRNETSNTTPTHTPQSTIASAVCKFVLRFGADSGIYLEKSNSFSDVSKIEEDLSDV